MFVHELAWPVCTGGSSLAFVLGREEDTVQAWRHEIRGGFFFLPGSACLGGVEFYKSPRWRRVNRGQPTKIWSDSPRSVEVGML